MNRSLPILLTLLLGACSSDLDLFGRRSRERAEGLAAPADLSGRSLDGGREIELRWTDRSTTETGFRVELAGAPIATASDVDEWTIVPAGSTSHVHPTRPGRRYHVRVFAVTDARQSAPSEQISVVTASSLPQAPPDLVAEGDSPSSIRLSWTDVEEESGYVIERAPAPGGPWTELPYPVDADVTEHVDAGLPSRSSFWYRVAAVNVLGAGGYSNEAQGWTLTPGVYPSPLPTPGEDDGYHTSIALDGTKPYVAYYNATLDRTFVHGPGPLRMTDVGTGVFGTSIAVSGGTAHMAAIAPNQLRRFSGTSSSGFGLTIVNGGNGWSASPRIVASTFGLQYVGRSSSSGDSLLYWAESSGASNGNFVASYAQIHGLALARDPSGHLHVALSAIGLGGGNPSLTYAFKNAGATAWNLTTLPSTGRPGAVSIATERSGPYDVPHVIWHDAASGRLHHVWRPDLLVGTGWRSEIVDAPPDRFVGAHNGLAVSGNTLHVVYYDATRGDLRYAKKVAGGAWQLSALDAAGDVGTYASIAASGSSIWVAYRDATNGDLKLATGTP